MPNIIESQLVITGKDRGGSELLARLSRDADTLVKALKNASTALDLQKQIGAIDAQVAALDRYQAQYAKFVMLGSNLQQQARAVDQLGAAIRNATQPTLAMQQAFDQAQAAVRATSAAFNAQATVVATDRAALEKLGVSGGQIASMQRSLTGAIETANKALAAQPGLLSRTGAAIRRTVVDSGLGYLAGPAILHGIYKAVEGGAEIESERVRLAAAGVPASEIAAAEKQAHGLAAQYPNVGVASILERYKELRSVLLHPSETPEMLPALVQAQAAMRALDRHGNPGESLIYAVKAAEVMGVAQDPKRFQHYLDAFVRAQQVMGKTITAEEQFNLAANFKASAATLSDRFKTTTGISLAQEMRGMRAGVGVDQFIKQIVGGFQGSQHAAAKEFVAMGLASKSDFETTKTGEIKGFKPGHQVAGASLAATDPDLWVYQYLLPAMEKHGFTDQQAQINEVRRMFTSARSADLVAKLIQQRQSYENHAKLYEHAQGLNATEQNQKDPFVALDTLGTSLKTFAATVTSPTMEHAAGALSFFAQQIANFGDVVAGWQKNHPLMAEAAGIGVTGAGIAGGGMLTYGLWKGLTGGFGLKTSAVALDSSAAALTRAAAELSLSAKGGLPGAPVGPAATAEKTGFWAALLSPKALGPAGAIAANVWGQDLWNTVLGAPTPAQSKKLNEGLVDRARDVWGDLFGGGSKAATLPHSFADRFYYGANPPGPAIFVPSVPMPPRSPLFAPPSFDERFFGGGEHHGGIGSDHLSSALEQRLEPAKAELDGKVEVETTVRVEPSPDFITRALSSVKSLFNGGQVKATGSTGSTGRAMPEVTGAR